MDFFSTELTALIETINTLTGEKGCPWDKKQTPHSLKKYIREEVSELLIAIDNKDSKNTCEELGDVFYLILMVSMCKEYNNIFDFGDVLTEINKKLIRRHPNVFENNVQLSEEQQKKQWEKIKAEEKSL